MMVYNESPEPRDYSIECGRIDFGEKRTGRGDSHYRTLCATAQTFASYYRQIQVFDPEPGFQLTYQIKTSATHA